jgi:hypothetical protein
MAEIANRFRKILRTVFRGIRVSAISLILQACFSVAYGPPNPSAAYGPPPPKEKDSISGTVISKETGKPIPGIKVSVEETESYKLTDNNGNFEIILPRKNYYLLKIQDIDGPANGGLFKIQAKFVRGEEINSPIVINMEADTGTAGN